MYKFHKNGKKSSKENVTKLAQEILEIITQIREPYKENVIKKIVGYPNKIPKRKQKKEFNSNLEWNNYKEEYDRKKNEIIESNREYNIKEKKIKRILIHLIVNKYINVEIIKKGTGYQSSFKEEYKLYKKSEKVIKGEKENSSLNNTFTSFTTSFTMVTETEDEYITKVKNRRTWN